MKKNRFLDFLRSYVIFFLLVSFTVTCCMLMFLTVLGRSLNIEFTADNLSIAAKLTFVNVIVISLIFTVIDGVRRKYMVERPVRQIRVAAEKMMRGDFSVRIPTDTGVDRSGTFDEVIECFNAMAAELSGIDTLRTDFISAVSHELKTPLTVMQNYASMLEAPDLSEAERLEYAGRIKEACGSLSMLVTNVLKLNKLENRQIPPAPKSFDLSEQLRESVLSFEELFDKKELEIECDIEDEVYVLSDPELLSIIWNNLLSNAVKFTPEGGKISIALFCEGNRIFVRISDTGIGMSAEVGNRIFEKFYQGDASRASSGNGLGLSLVKRVLDLTDGEISVESEEGRGSTFTVCLKRS